MRYSTEKIGNIIKKCREERKMTQDTLGGKIGVSGKQISNYEKGKLPPPTDVLFNLCDVFDCELGYLLGEESYSEGTQFYTAISQKMGLSTKAIKSVIGIIEKEKSRLNFEKHKYGEILDKLLQSDKLFELLEAISNLEKLYNKCISQMKNKEKIPDILEQKYKKETLDKAWEYWDVSEHDDNLPDFTDMEIEAIKDVNGVFDDLYDADQTINDTKSKIKYSRFLIQEALTLLLEELYPINNIFIYD